MKTPKATKSRKLSTEAKRETRAQRAKREAQQDGLAQTKPKAGRSHLEIRFARAWEQQGGPELVEEFQFHPERKWRADFAHLPSRTLIEIEGGAFGGRHTRGAGFKADLDKYLSAWARGYTVVRVGAHQVRADIVKMMIGRLERTKSMHLDVDGLPWCGKGRREREAADERWREASNRLSQMMEEAGVDEDAITDEQVPFWLAEKIAPRRK